VPVFRIRTVIEFSFLSLWISDKQDAFVTGIAAEFPGVPHRSCDNHLAHEGNPVPRLLTIAPSGGFLNRDITCCMEVLTMDFSLIDYLDEDACSSKLVELLPPDGLSCPRCGERQRLGIPRCHRAPRVDFQCGGCGRVFNAFPGTSLQGTHRRPSQLLRILRGVAQGTPTAQRAREWGCNRKELLTLRHRLPERARINLDRNPLDDDVVEADEMYQNAGKKG
jgi:transposase-like protein